MGAKTVYIEPGAPWENGYCESFNSRFCDEILNGGLFCSLREAQILIEQWRVHYNTVRPHSSLGYQQSAPAKAGNRLSGSVGLIRYQMCEQIQEMEKSSSEYNY